MRIRIPLRGAAAAAALLVALPLAAQEASGAKRVHLEKAGVSQQRSDAEAVGRSRRGATRPGERAPGKAQTDRGDAVSNAGEGAIRRRTGQRARLAGLKPAEREVAKRFLLEQKRHNERVAKLRRLREVFEQRGDQGKLARVEALLQREDRRFEKRKQLARKALATEQLQVLEAVGRTGTRTIRAQGAQRTSRAREAAREGSR